MALSATRPVPDALSASQQRLEVELLLGERVLHAEELRAGELSALTVCHSFTPSQWGDIGCLPLRHRGNSLIIAVPSHWGEGERQALSDRIANDGLVPELRMGLKEDIDPALSEQLAQLAIQRSTSPLPDAHSLLEDLSIGDQLPNAQEDADSSMDLEDSIHAPHSSPVVSLVNRILIRALDADSSDIHVEPQEDGLHIRFRQDGVLHPLERLPKSLVPAITSRLKIMADLDIAERRMPQDGRIRRLFRGRNIELRVSTLPGRWGEKVAMRILDSGTTQLGLDKLITDPFTLDQVRDLGSRPFGMILVTGPTGSGKSTTLYSLLAERNEPGINITTVEDPIEYVLKGITQTQVNRDKGYDFNTALRAFMRQDPDVLLVGETRDGETAKTAIEAALTGHLVLTTLHCNDAPSAIARLCEMGVEPYLVSASLLGIVSQRLLRRVCTACRISYHPSEQELGHFGLFIRNERNVSFFRARHHTDDGSAPCSTCQGRGYRGRVGVYEALRINETIASSIARGASTDVLRKLSLEAGMKSLLGYGLDLVRKGDTTLEEVERMLLTDTELESERRTRALTTLSCTGCGAGLKDQWLECPYCLTIRS